MKDKEKREEETEEKQEKWQTRKKQKGGESSCSKVIYLNSDLV